MNAKKIDVYKCSNCESYYQDKASANDCCKPNKCLHCEATISNGKQFCEACKEERRYASARKVDIDDYKEEAIWDWKSENYFYLDDFYEYYAENKELKMPKYVYACRFKPFELDLETILTNASHGHHEDILDSIKDEFELAEFINEWNTKRKKVGSYSLDICTIVLLK